MNESAAQAGWYPDPTDRHQYRRFDGTVWTDEVSDSGERSTDSPVLRLAPTISTVPDLRVQEQSESATSGHQEWRTTPDESVPPSGGTPASAGGFFRRNRKRLIATGVALMIVVAVTAGGVAYKQRSDALDHERNVAAQLRSDKADLESQVSSLDSKVSDLNTEVSDLNATIGPCRSAVATAGPLLASWYDLFLNDFNAYLMSGGTDTALEGHMTAQASQMGQSNALFQVQSSACNGGSSSQSALGASTTVP